MNLPVDRPVPFADAIWFWSRLYKQSSYLERLAENDWSVAADNYRKYQSLMNEEFGIE